MQPTPGIKTSEFWIMLLIVTVGALPSSGLFAVDSTVLKVAGLIGSVLAGMGYMIARTQLKVAHARAANDNAPDVASTTVAARAQAGFIDSGLLVFIAIMLTLAVVSTVVSCSWTKTAAKTAADDLADCTTGNLGRLAPIALPVGLELAEGKTSWDDVKGAAVAMGGVIGACFIGDVDDQVQKAAGSGSGMKLAPGGAMALAHYRSETGLKTKIKTAAGVR